jgi:hypothetical protein
LAVRSEGIQWDLASFCSVPFHAVSVGSIALDVEDDKLVDSDVSLRDEHHSNERID